MCNIQRYLNIPILLFYVDSRQQLYIKLEHIFIITRLFTECSEGVIVQCDDMTRKKTINNQVDILTFSEVGSS